MVRLFEYVLLAIYIAALLAVSRWIGEQAYSWLPPQATAEAQRVDQLFSFLTSIGAFIFLGLVGVMLYSAAFFRAPKGDFTHGHPARGSTAIEVAWLVVPSILVLWIAAQNINIYNQLNILGLKQVAHLHLFESPADAADQPKPSAEQIEVTAKQWAWSFRYPNGVVSPELHLPINESMRLSLNSPDVIHGFYVPEFRLKQDIVPRRDIDIVITPTRIGKYRLKDSQFSGTDFASMETDVYVESRQAYQAWIIAAVDRPTIIAAPAPPRTFIRSGWYAGVPTQSPIATQPQTGEKS